MSNMSYCRFTNTRSDLADCIQALREETSLSGFEAAAGKSMFREFLTFCRDTDIIGDFDHERIDGLFNERKE